MEEALRSWTAAEQQKMHKIPFTVKEVEEESVKAEVGGFVLVLIIPADNDSTITALPGDENIEDSVNEVLEILNEKLERIKRSQQNWLHRVLNCTLDSFERFIIRMPVEKWAQELPESELCSMAIEAAIKCRKALFEAVGDTDKDILAWSSIFADSRIYAVKLLIDVRGIFYESVGNENSGRALGFPLDGSFLSIEFCVDSDAWFETANLSRFKDAVISCSVSGSNKRAKISHPSPFGPKVLVPDLVRKFTESLSGKEKGNIFVGLLRFLEQGFLNLKNLCVLCKKELPPLSRLWFCDSKLCMYSSEESGIGVSLLQELQNTRTVQFEIRSALEAVKSGRDVFEPFPSALLKAPEIRDRSGFFSGETSTEGTHFATRMDNKNLALLEYIIGNFPPVTEMQECDNELDLVLNLSTTAALQDLLDTGNCSRLSTESIKQVMEYAQNLSEDDCLWIPYKVLKFLLFTNRLIMRPIPGSQMLPLDMSFAQFLLIYDTAIEESFKKRREKHGSVFAFHGSAACNWFSIIRNGLRACSNTTYMSRGMAYGKGVYLSTDFQLASLYCSTAMCIGDESNGPCHVIALCEVFGGTKYSKVHDILLVPPGKENDIAIRYLILFQNGTTFTEHSKPQVKHKQFLFGTDLVKHYMLQREQVEQEMAKANMLRRQELTDLLKKRRTSTNPFENIRLESKSG